MQTWVNPHYSGAQLLVSQSMLRGQSRSYRGGGEQPYVEVSCRQAVMQPNCQMAGDWVLRDGVNHMTSQVGQFLSVGLVSCSFC